MVKRFFGDIKRFFEYINYSSITILRSEVAYSYLNWVWWLLEPFLLMCVYTFISKYVFVSRPDNYPLFAMVGISIWHFFNKSVLTSVTVISANRGLLRKIYVPKFVLVMIRNQVSFIKMLFSFLIVVVLLIVYQIPPAWEWLMIIPAMIVFQLVTFGICCILAHVGVFIRDLANVITVLLRLVMYLSGIFYSVIDVMPARIGTMLLYLNPVALIIQLTRDVLDNQTVFYYPALGVWFVMGVLLSACGIWLIYKYENTYVKVV